MKNRTAFILAAVCFLLGLMGSSGAEVVQSPPQGDEEYAAAANWAAPVCPESKPEPLFVGVEVQPDGSSNPQYFCLAPGLGGGSEQVGWTDAATLQTVPN